MLSYSPYDNLSAQAYPAMFVGTGLWDSQVQYWEPAKYVAKLRDLDTGDGTIVLRTNMDAGHGGKSGRFRRYRELAEMYRSEEHTSELQSLMRISYAVFCLKKKNTQHKDKTMQ